MEPYLSRWQQCFDTGKACLDGFSVECHDPSHDMRCGAEEPPTWPQASLKEKECINTPERVVVLALEWTPHSGSGVFSLTSDGRAPASEVRAMFQRFRQGAAADTLFPSLPRLPLPEMACFKNTECQCLYYESGANQRLLTGTTVPSNLTKETIFFSPKCPDPDSRCNAMHSHCRIRGLYQTDEGVAIFRHVGAITNGSSCLFALYRRNITVCQRVSGSHVVAATPANDWYHAVDPDLSPPQRSPSTQCRDKTCISYYRNPASFTCRVSPRTLARAYMLGRIS
ncbi:hypothetical protein B0T24DRAFT_638577 [Lasiosphaeria ovina]|uniref:Uncharacterized protein n=1 Tax=Lasiosphaeria ovina TaxID=92902 RepID=A0AAE0MZM5_9PEZI|nr:hypothetical protein B0T24DRAFT_638577 [Lasiosphaeria ovina]